MVHELLGRGRRSARTRNELASVLGIEKRQLTRLIERERRAGFPILASTHKPQGYFLPENDDELERYCLSLAHRLREIEKTFDAVAAKRGEVHVIQWQQKLTTNE